MSEQAVIDSLEFARAAREMRGSVLAGTLERLRDSLYGGAAQSIDFAVRGGVDGQARPVLHVEISGRLELRCQRCLEALTYPLNLSNALLVVQRAEMPERELENPELPDCIEADPALDIMRLIEDEILLGMPYAPRHEDGICGQAAGRVNDVGEHPFATLSGLKTVESMVNLHKE